MNRLPETSTLLPVTSCKFIKQPTFRNLWISLTRVILPDHSFINTLVSSGLPVMYDIFTIIISLSRQFSTIIVLDGCLEFKETVVFIFYSVNSCRFIPPNCHSIFFIYFNSRLLYIWALIFLPHFLVWALRVRRVL